MKHSWCWPCRILDHDRCRGEGCVCMHLAAADALRAYPFSVADVVSLHDIACATCGEPIRMHEPGRVPFHPAPAKGGVQRAASSP